MDLVNYFMKKWVADEKYNLGSKEIIFQAYKHMAILTPNSILQHFP